MTEIGSSNEQREEDSVVDYNTEIKRLVCERLEADSTDANQHLDERKQRQSYGRVIIWIAGAVPLIILIFLGWQLLRESSVIANMQATPKAIIISASVLCFTIIYTVLIRGMFGDFQQKDAALPMREALDTIKQQQGDSHVG